MCPNHGSLRPERDILRDEALQKMFQDETLDNENRSERSGNALFKLIFGMKWVVGWAMAAQRSAERPCPPDMFVRYVIMVGTRA
jgi:hypothetical protein